MSLTSIYRLNGLLGLFWAASLWLGGNMMAKSYGWEGEEVTIPMITMAQLLGTSFFFSAIVFIMLPNWTSERQLKKATKTLILLQIIFLIVQIFHIYTKVIPLGVMQYLGIGLSTLFILLFYLKSR